MKGCSACPTTHTAENTEMKTPILLNMSALAKALGVSSQWIRAMRRCGFPMPGRRATVADALQWLKENPDFEVRKTLIAPKPPRSNLPVGASDTKHEQASLSDQHTASPGSQKSLPELAVSPRSHANSGKSTAAQVWKKTCTKP